MTDVAYIDPKNPPLTVECETIQQALIEISAHLYFKRQLSVIHTNGVFIINVFGVEQ